jgi:hypothetical protein
MTGGGQPDAIVLHSSGFLMANVLKRVRPSSAVSVRLVGIASAAVCIATRSRSHCRSNRGGPSRAHRVRSRGAAPHGSAMTSDRQQHRRGGRALRSQPPDRPAGYDVTPSTGSAVWPTPPHGCPHRTPLPVGARIVSSRFAPPLGTTIVSKSPRWRTAAPYKECHFGTGPALKNWPEQG